MANAKRKKAARQTSSAGSGDVRDVAGLVGGVGASAGGLEMLGEMLGNITFVDIDLLRLVLDAVPKPGAES